MTTGKLADDDEKDDFLADDNDEPKDGDIALIPPTELKAADSASKEAGIVAEDDNKAADSEEKADNKAEKPQPEASAEPKFNVTHYDR